MSLASNFFAYPLVGSSGCNTDGVDPMEMLNFLFKKQFGFPNTKPYIKYNNERTINNFKPSTKNLQYSQIIPSYPPNDLYLDTTFSNYYSGINQARFVSSNYPYIAFYSTLIMGNASTDSTASNAWWISNPNATLIFTQNAISPTYGINPTQSPFSNYFGTTKVYTNTGTQLSFTTNAGGSWLFDTDSGVLTFYDIPTTGGGVSVANPPRISFWRYEGLIGNNAIMNIQDF